MPGHKGVLPPPLDDAAPFDLTELPLTGCLTDGQGPLLETEAAFSAWVGSGATLLSAGGSSLCIQAMLSLFCRPGAPVLMARASHVAAVNAAALLGLEPVWLWPDQPSGVGTPGRISPRAVGAALERRPDAAAVYLTSPDYFGALCDIAGVSAVCRRRGVPLLVDNAHGPHLSLFEGMHPLALGADACCESLHKTLPALTGAALLHLRDGGFAVEARRRMAVFASTSPSYLVMLSADLLTDQREPLTAAWRDLAGRLAPLERAARAKGIRAVDGPADPARVALLFPEGGRMSALALLNELSIEAEYLSERHIVLLPAPHNDLAPIAALIGRMPPCGDSPALPALTPPRRALSPREASLSPAESLPLSQALGRVAAAPLAACPPGLPLVMPGEVIEAACLPKNSGARRCFVVK